MAAAGWRRQPSTRRGIGQKAQQRLAFGRILDAAHRHPQTRKHLGRIGEKAIETRCVPVQTLVARPAQRRGVIERRIAADPASDQAREIGPGRPRSAGSRLWQARQGANRWAPFSSAAAGPAVRIESTSKLAKNLTQVRQSGSPPAGWCRIRRPMFRRTCHPSAAHSRPICCSGMN